MWGSLRTAAPHGAAGFTLLELLVVILIIGIMATFAVLSIGGRSLDDHLDTEARRLQQLLSLAAEEAVRQGGEIGFRYTADGYSFLMIRPDDRGVVGDWIPVTDDPTFRERRLEAPFYLELRVEDRAVPPAVDKEGEAPRPQVMLTSSGETTAFSLRVRARDYGPYFQLDSNLMGQMKLQRKDGS